MKKVLYFTSVLLLICLSSMLFVGCDTAEPPIGVSNEVDSLRLAPGNCPDMANLLVTRVIDGNTIELKGGEVVRYIGTYAPERFWSEAIEFNSGLVAGQRIYLTYDVDKADRHGRTLAYVYLPDGTFVNAELIRQGYVKAVSYAPNVRHSSFLMDSQRLAMMDGCGMWGACYEYTPHVNLRPPPRQYVTSVKSDEDVFHFCTCFYVDRIKEENKRYFTSYQAAIDAGLRPCEVCLDFAQDEPEPEPEPEPEDVIVYITNYGNNYHRSWCRYLWNSKIAISISEAIDKEYTPCSVCRP